MPEEKKKTKYDAVDENEVTSVAEREQMRVDGSLVFWAPAEKYQIANLQKEIKQAGEIVQPEMPLRFEGHLCVCGPDEKEKIEFIKNSNSFKAGIVKLCKDMAEANKFTRQHGSLKSGMRIMHVSDSSSVVIGDKPGTAGTTEPYVESKAQPQVQVTE